jgi:signal transduction histidine kinase/ActR/RegA family two-component response regulator
MIRSASIRSKLMHIAMATTCVSLALLAGAWGTFEFVSYRKAMITEMATVRDMIGANSTAALAFNDQAGAKEILAALKPLSDVRLGCVFDAKGQLFASYQRAGERERCPRSPMPDGISLAEGVFSQSSAVMLDNERIGTLHLVASQTTLWNRLRLSALVLAIAVAASTLAAYLLSSRLQRLVSRPILDLATTAGHISERRDYTLRAPQHSTDEVGVAVGAFNHMLDRIQDADRALREAGQQSRKQAQFLASILDNMGEGLVVIDQQGEVLVWNAAAKRIVGPSPVGIGFEQWPRHLGVLRDANQAPLDAGDLPLARALRGEVVTDQELYLEPTLVPRGRWVNASARPLRDEHGNLLGAISVFRDISLQKQAELELKASEAQLRQSQKMDAVGQLAGGIAHDFNNLLTAICGYGSFAHELLPPHHAARKDIEEVLKAAERAATLTHQLLAFSRKQVLAPRLLDLNAALRASEQMLRRLIGENIDLSVRCGANLGRVVADSGQIDQVILNLALNARDAMPRGGRLTIQTSNVQVQAPAAHGQGNAPAGSYTKLTVSDTGVGMSEAVQARIFEPFFTTKAPGKGTGLGLSTVYGIVQQSGGHITVSSREGVGTTFDVYLPCTESGPADTVAPPPASMAMPRGSETILLAEDEEQVRNLGQAILTKLGYEVLVARDGVEALELQARHQGSIHLLISDVVMPRMSGDELAQRLLERVPGIRILFVSGYTADATLSSHLPANELTLIPKPFTAELLALKTREILDRKLDES